MVVAFEAGTDTVVVEGNLIDRRTGDHEADVCKGLWGVIAPGGEIWIAEVGAGIVSGAVEGCDRAGAVF